MPVLAPVTRATRPVNSCLFIFLLKNSFQFSVFTFQFSWLLRIRFLFYGSKKGKKGQKMGKSNKKKFLRFCAFCFL